jgi:hypothetical protein
MTVHHPLPPPRAWKAEELRQDQSWIQPLSPAEIAGFEEGLAHAKASGKDWLDMSAADCPLNDAAREALQRAFARTQTGYGICLIKGFPVVAGVWTRRVWFTGASACTSGWHAPRTARVRS